MKLFSKFLNKKNHSDYAISLDIGTEVVKALIFRINSDNKGEIVGVGKQPQRLGDMQSGAVTDIAGVIDACDKAIDKGVKQCGIRPEQAIVGIAGELVKGSTTTVKYERLKPKSRIDLAELKNIIQKVQWKAFDKVRKQLSWETGLSEIDVKLVNAAIVDVNIDGYKVNNPLGFQGKEIAISVFNSYAPLVHLGALQTITAELELDLLSIACQPYAVARCIGVEDANEFNAIFIDIGGGTSDIAVVRNGGIEGTKMFALGGRAFTKRIASDLDLNFNEAEKRKLDYSKTKGSEYKKVKSALESDSEVWISGVELSLEEFSKSDLLPSKILLCGGGSSLPEIKSKLKEKNWSSELPFARPPQISFIKPADIPTMIDKTSSVSYPQDITAMALANLAIELAGEEDVIQNILRRVVKIMQT